MGKSESGLFSLSNSRTFDPIAAHSLSLENASSSWIASFSRFLDYSRNVARSCGVQAASANSAQRVIGSLRS
jgi:hypothetical protein